MADNRSAAWHYREAEKYIELAKSGPGDLGPGGGVSTNNYAELAQAHAALAQAGANLMRSVQSPERADLLDCVSGRAKE